MKKATRRLILGATLAVLWLAAVFCNSSVLMAQAPSEPDIRITDVPLATGGGPTEMYPIAGTVTGVKDYKDYKVVIYCFAGAQWWVQPFDYAPTTAVNSNGKFETETHGGSIYAALLVRATFRPKATLTALPEVGGDIIARHRVAGKKE